MNTPAKKPRTYKVTLVKDGTSTMIPLRAFDRRQAVKIALNWFWYEYKGALGPAHKSMTVNDPYEEVRYGPKFLCNDRMNKLLPLDVCLRLFKESKGELVIDKREGKRHHQPNSVRRVKRRRDFGKFVAPAIRRMNNGVMYYRITRAPQRSHGGRRYRKRKYVDVRLDARTLEDALGEIQMRGLHLRHALKAARQLVVRELKVVAYVSGLIELDKRFKTENSGALRRYIKAPRQSSTTAA